MFEMSGETPEILEKVDHSSWFFNHDSKVEKSSADLLAENLFEELSADLRAGNTPFPLPAVRSVSIARDKGVISARVRLEITVPEWKENKQAIIEKYGSSIEFLEVSNFKIVPR